MLQLVNEWLARQRSRGSDANHIMTMQEVLVRQLFPLWAAAISGGCTFECGAVEDSLNGECYRARYYERRLYKEWGAVEDLGGAVWWWC